MNQNSKRQDLANRLADHSMVILLSQNFSGIDHNFRYITQITDRDCAYIAVKKGNEWIQTLYIPPLDEHTLRWVGRMLTIEEAKEISGLDTKLKTAFENDVKKWISSGEIENIYLDLDAENYHALQPAYKYLEKLQKRWPTLQYRNVNPIIATLRMYKTEEEIQILRSAMNYTAGAIKHMMLSSKNARYEYELQAEFDYYLAKNGVKTSFVGISSHGNEFCLHYNAATGPIADGDLVLMDLAAEVEGYTVDISRVFPINGKFSEKQRAIYEIALAGNKAVRKAVRPGVKFSELLEICKRTSFEGLRDLGLLSDYSEIGKYFWHGVTHYIGLDVHDVGTYDVPIDQNMAFVIDSGLYIPEWKVGLRVEDNVVVTENGCEDLSASIPREMEEIEALLSCR